MEKIDKLKKERNDLAFALNDINDEDCHIGICYEGYVDDYVHKGTTEILKGFLFEMEDELKAKISNRIDDIENDIQSLS